MKQKTKNIICLSWLGVLTILLLVIGLTYPINKIKGLEKENEGLKNRVITLEGKQLDFDQNFMDTIDALSVFYDDYSNNVSVLDNNVDIYNTNFQDIWERLENLEYKQQIIIDYLQ